MFPRENRLSFKDDFEKIKKEGILFQSESFAGLVYDRHDAKPVKIGIIVSNKISKNAVVRNRTRRIIRQGLIPHLSLIKNGQSLIFLAKKNIVKKRSDKIVEEISTFLKQAKLVK